MTVHSKIVAGRKVVWDDGLVDYTQAGDFSKTINQEINRIKKEVTSEHRPKYLSDLKKLADQNIAYWKEQLNKRKSEAQQHIDLLKKEASKLRKKDRNLTAEEVSVLTYHANILKSKVALLSSDSEFKEFLEEIAEAPEQVRRAFLDNAPSILESFGGSEDDKKISIHETKNIINNIEKSFMSEEELQAEGELNAKIKEYEQVQNGAMASEIALKHTISNLQSQVNWELTLAGQGDEESSNPYFQ